MHVSFIREKELLIHIGVFRGGGEYGAPHHKLSAPFRTIKFIKDLSILQYDVIFLAPDFLRKLRGFSKSFAYVGSVAKGNIG